jgi:hypothetical protein
MLRILNSPFFSMKKSPNFSQGTQTVIFKYSSISSTFLLKESNVLIIYLSISHSSVSGLKGKMAGLFLLGAGYSS